MYQPNWQMPEQEPKPSQPAQPAREPTMDESSSQVASNRPNPAPGIAGLALLVGVLVLLVLLGYRLTWTGFFHKTLWDWMQLLILPAVLAIGGYLFTLTTSRDAQKSTQLRNQTEREIASDNQREAALQAYIDQLSELLLEKKLRESAEDDEVRTIARVHTLTVLTRLDTERKGSVLQFLYESGLIHKDKSIVDLSGAALLGADLPTGCATR
jgi:hypothetical protein